MLVTALAGRRAVAQSLPPTFYPDSMVRSESLHICIAELSVVSARSGSTEGMCTVTRLATRGLEHPHPVDLSHTMRVTWGWSLHSSYRGFPLDSKSAPLFIIPGTCVTRNVNTQVKLVRMNYPLPIYVGYHHCIVRPDQYMMILEKMHKRSQS